MAARRRATLTDDGAAYEELCERLRIWSAGAIRDTERR